MANHLRSASKERFWRRALARHQVSGLNIRDFCLREHLSEPSYYHWRRELAGRDRRKLTPRKASRKAPRAAPSAFVPVRVIADQEKARLGGSIEIVLAGGRIVRVGPGFERQTLAAVIQVLEAKPC